MNMKHDIDKIRRVYDEACEQGFHAYWEDFVEEAKEKHEAMGGMADEEAAAKLIVAEYRSDDKPLFWDDEESYNGYF